MRIGTLFEKKCFFLMIMDLYRKFYTDLHLIFFSNVLELRKSTLKYV